MFVAFQKTSLQLVLSSSEVPTRTPKRLNMRIFVCLLLAVASCKAGFDGGYGASNEVAEGHGGASGYGGDFGGQNFNGGQGHTQALAQGYNVYEGNQDLGGHGGQGFGGQDLSGHGGGQAFGGFEQLQQFGGHDGGQNYGGDSYLQAAHDSGIQEHGGQQQFGGQGHIGGQLQGFPLQDAGHEFDGNHGSNFGIVADQGNFGHSGFGGDQGFGGQSFGGHAEAIPVGEHTDVESPVEVPQYKHVTFPIPKIVHINVPKPVLVGVPQPYPVKVPVNKPVAVPVETEISIPFEKVVPYPVFKHVPYPVEKHVPIKVEKTVTVHVPQPYPIKIPVYKTIHHHSGHH